METVADTPNEQTTSDNTTDGTTNESSSDQPTDQSDSATHKLLKQVTYTDRRTGPEKNIFYYSEGRLMRALKGMESTISLHFFTYNDDNKIIFESRCDDYPKPAESELESYDCMTTVDYREFNYESQVLTSIIEGGELEGIVSFDERGNLISLVYPSGLGINKYYIYDENNRIISTTSTYGDYGNTYTYEFDGKRNPFNSLWEVFGYLETDFRINHYGYTATFFKENPTKVYKNNELVYEANYNYDSDDYPISCSFIEYLDDGTTWSNVIILDYVQ